MKKKDLFPYSNRSLGTESLIFDKDERKTPEHLALITLVNLQSGDHFILLDHHCTVMDCSPVSTEVSVGGDTETINEENMTESLLFKLLVDAIGLDINKRVSSIETIIERDPALYRARAGGWILIDELVSSSGNVQYPTMEYVIKKSDKVNVKNVSEKNKPTRFMQLDKKSQMGFEF